MMEDCRNCVNQRGPTLQRPATIWSSRKQPGKRGTTVTIWATQDQSGIALNDMEQPGVTRNNAEQPGNSEHSGTLHGSLGRTGTVRIIQEQCGGTRNKSELSGPMLGSEGKSWASRSNPAHSGGIWNRQEKRREVNERRGMNGEW